MPSKIFSVRPTKFLTIFYLVIHQIFPNFSLFRISCPAIVAFHENSLLGCLPNAASCPDNDICIFLFAKLPTFFYKNWSLGCPLGWMPAAVAPSAPPSARHCPCKTAWYGICKSIRHNYVYGVCHVSDVMHIPDSKRSRTHS